MKAATAPEQVPEAPVAPAGRRWTRWPLPSGVTTAAIAAILLVAWRSDAVRGAADRIDHHLVAVLYVGLATLVAAGWSGAVRARLGDPRVRRRLAAARPAGLVGIVAAFSVPIFAAWHRGYAFSMIGGAVPWSDAHMFSGGAQRLLLFGRLDGYNSRRPINAMFLSVRLAVTGFDLRLAAALGMLVLAAAAFLAVRTVARDLGPVAGMALFVGVFGFARYYVPITFSETLGVTYALVAFACVWNALRHRSRRLAIGSVFMLAIAFDVRAGVFLLPVLMALWLARYLRAGRGLDLRLLAGAALAIVVGVGLNIAALAGLGGDTGNSFGNGGMLLYGMARGHAPWDPVDVSWALVYTEHPEIIGMSDGDRDRLVNRLARREILDHPRRFLDSTFQGYENYLVLSKRAILDPWPVRWHRPLMLGALAAIVAALAVRHRRGGDRRVWADLALFAGMVLVVPALIGIENGNVPPLWLAPALAAMAFVAFVVVGTRVVPVDFAVPTTLVALLAFVIGLPFIGTDSVRLFADGIAFLALPLVLAVVVLTRPRRPAPDPPAPAPAPVTERRTTAGALPLVFGVGFLATTVMATPVALAAVNAPKLEARRCADGRAAEPLLGGVALRIVPDPVGPGRHVDEVGQTVFATQAVHFAPVPYNHLAGITAPVTLIEGLTQAGTDRYAIVDGLVDPPRTSVLYLCGQLEDDPMTDLVFSILQNPTDVFRGHPLASE